MVVCPSGTNPGVITRAPRTRATYKFRSNSSPPITENSGLSTLDLGTQVMDAGGDADGKLEGFRFDAFVTLIYTVICSNYL